MTNQHFNILHTHITPGPDIGSDHIPTIINITTIPIKTQITPHINTKTLNIQEYKHELSQLTLPDLDQQPTQNQHTY